MKRCPRRWRGAPTGEKVSPSAVRTSTRNAGATGTRITNCTRTSRGIFPTWTRFRSQRRGHVRRFVSAQSGEPRQVKVKWARTSLFFFFLPRTRPTWTPFQASKRCPRRSRHCTDVVEDVRGTKTIYGKVPTSLAWRGEPALPRRPRRPCAPLGLLRADGDTFFHESDADTFCVRGDGDTFPPRQKVPTSRRRHRAGGR